MLRVSHRSTMSALLPAVALILAAIAMPSARAGSFSFAVAHSSFPAYFGAPSINDFGVVNFNAVTINGSRVMYSGDRLLWQDDSGLEFLGHTMTNNHTGDSASTVYHGGYDVVGTFTEFIWMNQLNIFANLGETYSSGYSRFGSPVINDAQLVAFFAENDNGTSGIYTGRRSPDVAPIVLSTGLYSTFGEVVSINNSGQVAFTAANSLLQTLVVSSDGSNTEYIVTTGGTYKSLYTPSINDHGMVVFRAELTEGGSGIYVGGGGGQISTIANTEGQFAAFEFPVINNGGDVAFGAIVDGGGLYGIFTGGDPVADKVIQQGDPLFGSTLSDLRFYRSLNNHGQIAFRYVLANGEQGIAVATPMIVPEAASLSLVLVGLGVMAASRRKRSNLLV